MDLTFTVEQTVCVEAIEDCLAQAVKSPMLGRVLSVVDAPLVSVDFVGSAYSSIVDMPQTRVAGQVVKVLAWYDNEWGFSNRMLDTAAYWLAKD